MIFGPVPIVAAQLVEGDPERPDGEAEDDGVGRGREQAEAEHAELRGEHHVKASKETRWETHQIDLRRRNCFRFVYQNIQTPLLWPSTP